MRIVHLSDIHLWRYPRNPVQLLNKRFLGVLELLRSRARRFRLERLHEVVARVRGLDPDHILITGDLTTTALPAEFRDARAGLAELLADHSRVIVLPGNHDRYTRSSMRDRHFETYFGAFLPAPAFPWLRWLDAETAILGLDPTRPHLTARGFLPPAQLERARGLIADAESRPKRLIVACHYPVVAPPQYERELARKRLVNAPEMAAWLAGIGPHLYCCGHIHAAWAFTHEALPDQLGLNAGAPLLRDRTGSRRPGFLEILLDGPGVTVLHHAWTGTGWLIVPMAQNPRFFPAEPAPRTP